VSGVEWRSGAADGLARTGVLRTPHGEVATPAFMPVGTRGTVKTVDSRDLALLGAQMLLANTYHLMLRPGADTVEALGEIQRFMGWSGPVLTDSGGYQVFSLKPRIDDAGVTFKSTYDGTVVALTPEGAVQIQETLGSDIAMSLDVLIGLPAEPAAVEAAMERTLRWGARSVAARRREDRALFGIVQGGVDPDLRSRSAAATAALGFDGYGIGGLSVGESVAERNLALEASLAELPQDATRYVMGLGDTEGILDAVARGADLFDCVLPTRLARHGKVLHRDGDFSIRLTKWAVDDRPIDDACSCVACTTYSRGYVRHLFVTKELLGLRLLTLHNLTYTADLMEDVRAAIASRSFAEMASRRKARRSSGRTQA